MVDFGLTWVVIIASSVWVAFDARKIESQEGEQPISIFNRSSIGWFVLCILLWIIFFPMYILKRPGYKRMYGKDGSNTSAIVIGISAIIIFALLSFLVSSGYIKGSTSDLQKQVQQSISDTFAKNPYLSSVKINSLALVHRSGNLYDGLMDTTAENGNHHKMIIEVTYDGKTFLWRIRP